MLADPRRVRRLITAILVLLIAIPVRLLTNDQPHPDTADQSSAPGPTVTDSGPVADLEPERARPAVPAPEAPETSDAGETDRQVEHAQQVAADFALEYLTWTHDEPHDDRMDRLTPHATDELTETLADARVTGAAQQAEQSEWSQSVEVHATQTNSVRRRSVEVTVMTELTIDDPDGERTVASNLGVVVRQQEGTWLVADLN